MPSACSGSDADACQEEVIVQSICLVQPDGVGCDDLRARRLLPSAPPTPDELTGCYVASEEAGPPARAVICIAKDRVSSRLPTDRWEQARVKRWRREDVVSRAVWVVETEDGRSYWLIASWLTLPANRRSLVDKRLVLRLVDDTGRWNVDLSRTYQNDAERSDAAVPRVEDVCAIATKCIEAVQQAARARARLTPRPPARADEGEVEGDFAPAIAPLVTLHGCWDVHAAALASLDPGQPVPDACQGMPALDR